MKSHLISSAGFITLAVLASLVPLQAAVAVTFQPGDVFWARVNGSAPLGLNNITGGGSFSAADQFAEIARSPGQMTWRYDLTTAYLTEFDNSRVVAISPTDTITSFATGIAGPTGLLWTASGRLLVVSNTFLGAGRIFDITHGGDFTGATPFATGFSSSRNLLQTSGGEILIVDQSAGAVYDVTAGGNFSLATAYAHGFSSPVDLIQTPDGRILLTDPADKAVFDITSGGHISSTPMFASGKTFSGITVDGEGRILSSEFGSSLVFDISSGSPVLFASNSSGHGHSLLDTVPVPEPSGMFLCLLSACAILGMRKRA